MIWAIHDLTTTKIRKEGFEERFKYYLFDILPDYIHAIWTDSYHISA